MIGDAAEFLKKLQWDEGEGKNPKDDFYGGAGYDSKSRPDLSNTQFFLDALKAAGVSQSDPAVQRALIFVSRCQNLKGEFNDQPWAGKINDGSFIYSAAGGGESKTDEPGIFRGYGCMTYAGVKSMIYCGVGKDDPRMKKALEWMRSHYTLEANPGMPEAAQVSGAVLLLPHDGQVPVGPRRGHVHRCDRREARLASRDHGGTRKNGNGPTAPGSMRRIAGWRATQTWSRDMRC